jgi:hypothetical protein
MAVNAEWNRTRDFPLAAPDEEDTDVDRDGKLRRQNRLAWWCATSLQAAKGSRAAEVLSHEPRASNERERMETEQGGGADEGIGELGA